jgi:LysM repeat protein
VSIIKKVIFVVGIAGALLAPGVAHVAARQAHPVPLRLVHVVKPGETLWQIARGLDPRVDVVRAVDRLIAVNHLRSPLVHPGQPLFLPAG